MENIKIQDHMIKHGILPGAQGFYDLVRVLERCQDVQIKMPPLTRLCALVGAQRGVGWATVYADIRKCLATSRAEGGFTLEGTPAKVVGLLALEIWTGADVHKEDKKD